MCRRARIRAGSPGSEASPATRTPAGSFRRSTVGPNSARTPLPVTRVAARTVLPGRSTKLASRSEASFRTAAEASWAAALRSAGSWRSSWVCSRRTAISRSTSTAAVCAWSTRRSWWATRASSATARTSGETAAIGSTATAMSVNASRSLTSRRLSRPSRIGSRGTSLWCELGCKCDLGTRRGTPCSGVPAQQAACRGERHLPVRHPCMGRSGQGGSGSAGCGLPREAAAGLRCVHLDSSEIARLELRAKLVRRAREDRIGAVVDRHDRLDAE